MLGKAIKSFRKDIVLASKVGNRWLKDQSGWDWDVTPSYIFQAIDDSLSRLQTDYLDLYQIHGGTNQDDFEAIVDTMEQLVKQGKIRHYGISSIRPNVFAKYCKHSNIVSNMMQYSILDNRPEPYFPLFEQSDVSIIARGVLAQGLLVNKKAKGYIDYDEAAVVDIQRQLKTYIKVHQCNEIILPLAYVLQQKCVASALIGTRTIDQLEAILDASNQIQPIDFRVFEFYNIFYKNHNS